MWNKFSVPTGILQKSDWLEQGLLGPLHLSERLGILNIIVYYLYTYVCITFILTVILCHQEGLKQKFDVRTK